MKILLINHTKSLVNAITQSLDEDDFSLDFAESVQRTVEEIQRYNSDIVIVNWADADFNIETLCKKIKKIKHTKYLYLIVIADRSSQKNLHAAVDAGANDIIFRPFGKEELQIRMQIAKKTIKLEESYKKFRKDMLKLAKEDPHTNLLNRRALLDEVLKEMGRASREMKFISAVIASVTNFRELADFYGSEIGDGILIEISRRLNSSCRPYDKLGRVGIADFLLILPDTGVDNAGKVAERIMSSTAMKQMHVNGKKFSVNLSIGIAELNPSDVVKNDHADNHLMNDLILDSLIRRTELALQKAKERGKNSIEIYSFV